jgi:hypothetical protein
MTQVLTKSSLSTARLCPRLYDYQYRQLYRSAVEAEALRFGTLVHHGLEQLWSGRPVAWPGSADRWDLARARPMLAGYAARWDQSLYETLAVEQAFECPLVDPRTGIASDKWVLGGKFDAVAREKATGRVFLIEHKTSGSDISPGSPYWTRLRLDTQISVYMEGARSLGYDPVGVVYDVLGKPSIRPLKAGAKRAVDETPEEFEVRCVAAISEDPGAHYQRGEVVRLEDEMRGALVDICEQAEVMGAGHTFRNPDACERFGRLCSFFEVCSGSARLDGNRDFVKLPCAHPELEQPKGA